MLRLGKVLHVTGRGAVVKVEHLPKLDDPVCDKGGKKIGNAGDIFGPVRSPYLLIKPARGVTKERLVSLIGGDVYMGVEKRGRKG